MSIEVQRESTLEEELVGRILFSRHFAKAPLLSAFLSYVCERSLHEGASRISEQEIGTTVFGREPGYDSREDNIVRNYARQLRRRLDDYYATDGSEETILIQVPKGGYVPLFLSKSDEVTEPAGADLPQETDDDEQELPQKVFTADEATPGRHEIVLYRSPARWPWMVATVCLAIAFGAALVAHGPLRAHFSKALPAESRSDHEFWSELFSPDRDTLIVPSDSAFVTVEDMKQRTYSLTEYLSWSPVEHSGAGFDVGLRTRKYTSVDGFETLLQLTRLPEWRPDRTSIRTSRDLHVEDLKDDNLILLGSVYSIPWIEVLDNELNFRFVYEPKTGHAHIENRKPAPGEAAIYANHWNGVDETDYAVVALVPNLNHTGKILLLEGLDGAGTYAAKDLLFRNDGMQTILAKCRRADGTLRGFEALLESTSVDSHSTGIHVVSLHTVD